MVVRAVVIWASTVSYFLLFVLLLLWSPFPHAYFDDILFKSTFILMCSAHFSHFLPFFFYARKLHAIFCPFFFLLFSISPLLPLVLLLFLFFLYFLLSPLSLYSTFPFLFFLHLFFLLCCLCFASLVFHIYLTSPSFSFSSSFFCFPPPELSRFPNPAGPPNKPVKCIIYFSFVIVCTANHSRGYIYK